MSTDYKKSTEIGENLAKMIKIRKNRL